MGNDNILIVVVVAVVGYFLLTSKTWIGTAKAAVSGISAIAADPCSGYGFSPPLYLICKALNPEPAKAADGTPIQSPQTPAPQQWRPPMAARPELCPYNPSLLIGDRRCQMPTGTFTTGYGVFEGGLFTPEQYFK